VGSQSCHFCGVQKKRTDFKQIQGWTMYSFSCIFCGFRFQLRILEYIAYVYIYSIYMYYIVDQYFHYSSCIILYALIGGENYMSLFTGSAFTSQGPPRVKSSIIPLVIYGDLMDFNGDLWWFLTHRTERDWKMVCSRRASETGKLAHGEANVWVCGMFIYTL
jgi:hypothetical protein